MAEHFYAHEVAARAGDVLLFNLLMNVGHLLHVEFARQYHHVGKLGVKLQGLDVANIELRGEVHLHSLLAAVVHHRHIRGDDGRDAGFCGGIDDAAHVGQVTVVDKGVHREVGFHTLLIASLGDFAQILDIEVVGTVGAHIELPDTEIHGVGTGLQRCGQRLA